MNKNTCLYIRIRFCFQIYLRHGNASFIYFNVALFDVGFDFDIGDVYIYIYIYIRCVTKNYVSHADSFSSHG